MYSGFNKNGIANSILLETFSTYALKHGLLGKTPISTGTCSILATSKDVTQRCQEKTTTATHSGKKAITEHKLATSSNMCLISENYLGQLRYTVHVVGKLVVAPWLPI